MFVCFHFCLLVFTFEGGVIFIDNNNNKFHIKTFRLVFSVFVLLKLLLSVCASCFCIETFDFFSGLKCVRICVGEISAVVYVVLVSSHVWCAFQCTCLCVRVSLG